MGIMAMLPLILALAASPPPTVLEATRVYAHETAPADLSPGSVEVELRHDPHNYAKRYHVVEVEVWIRSLSGNPEPFAGMSLIFRYDDTIFTSISILGQRIDWWLTGDLLLHDPDGRNDETDDGDFMLNGVAKPELPIATVEGIKLCTLHFYTGAVALGRNWTFVGVAGEVWDDRYYGKNLLTKADDLKIRATSETPIPWCLDLDKDGDMDLADFALLQAAMSGTHNVSGEWRLIEDEEEEPEP